MNKNDMSRDGEYDLAEARHLIGAAVARSNDNATRCVITPRKEEANKKLMQALVELDHYVDAIFSVVQLDLASHRNTSSLQITLDGVNVYLSFEDKGHVLNWNAENSEPGEPDKIDVPLDFDPVAKQFYGPEMDKYYAPKPGEPHRRRSAVAVIIENALKLIARHTPR